jgi:hypothetical protein
LPFPSLNPHFSGETRLTNLAYAASAGLVIFGFGLVKPSERRQAWRDIASFGCPLALCGILLGTYNAARFGSPFEFGWHYQLQGLALPPEVGFGWHSLRDLELYLFAVPTIGPEYPYFHIGYNLLEPLGHYLWFPDQSQFAGGGQHSSHHLSRLSCWLPWRCSDSRFLSSIGVPHLQ